MVGETGFEPATPHSRTKWQEGPTVTSASQTVETAEVPAAPTVQPSQPFAGSTSNVVTRLLPGPATPRPGTKSLLTVREVAARLGVSRATVYKLCTEGTLPHLRLSNVIRFDPDALEAYLAAAPAGLKGH